MNTCTWSALSQLLEQALDLTVSERRRWLDGLSPEHQARRPTLEALLDLATSTDAESFLATLPRFTSNDAIDLTGSEGGPDARPMAGDAVGPYRLIRSLADGGHGSVWLATRADGLIDRPVAIKRPHGLAHRTDLRKVLARERQILAGLTHPHIARLYDAGVTDHGVPFLALEYVEGVPITEHCTTRALDVDARLRLFQQVVRAVAYAHGRLVIHRDLKPTNVLVTSQGDVRLLDFGIAAMLQDDAGGHERLPTLCGQAMTLPYASPEQIRREPLGVASDIYSLGVMLHELLTGVLPYAPARNTPGGWEEAILGREPSRPSASCADPSRRLTLHGDLDTIVLKALKKAPAERYATAAALGEDIERYLRGLAVEAQGDSRTYRTRKFIARHRWGVAAVAMTVTALLAAASLATWQMRDARRQRDVAQYSRDRAEAFGDFLQTLLLDAGNDGRPLTATELLDRGAEMLDRQRGLSDHVAAYMRFEVSRLYLRFERLDREQDLLARSAEAAQRIGDTDLYAAARCATAASLATHDRAAADVMLRDAEAALAAGRTDAVLSQVDCTRARARLLRAGGDLAGAVAVASAMLTTVERDGSANESQRELLRRLLSEFYRATDRPREALRLSEQSLHSVRDAGRAGTMAELDALSAHADHLYRVGEVRTAAMLAAEVLTGVARNRPLVEPLGYRSNLGLYLLRLGEPARALELIDADLELARRVKNKPTMAIVHLNLSRAQLALNRLDEARRHLGAADDIWYADPAAFRRMLTESAMQHAALLMAEGRGADAWSATEALLRSMGYPEQKTAPGLDRALRLGASIALSVNDGFSAERLATDALARSQAMARVPLHSADVGTAALTRARARLAIGDARGARQDAELAASALDYGLGEGHPDTRLAAQIAADPGVEEEPPPPPGPGFQSVRSRADRRP